MARSSPPLEDLRLEERLIFAAKIRAARAVLNWSQVDLAGRVGVAQPSIHRIEQGSVDVRRSTAIAIERAFIEAGIRFEDLEDGGFKLVVPRKAGTEVRPQGNPLSGDDVN